MQLVNTYEQLPEAFYERAAPQPVRAPRLVLWNQPLAAELGLDQDRLADPASRAAVFSGNERLAEFDPLALAYAGHQFGHFVPSLGDGRAHLLCELVDRAGTRRDLQLKGSGPTRFSRGGDGRCGLGPALREFLMSEALHALRVPTTRSLAVVTTGEVVHRDPPQPGAVVTRVALSHLRVGTFQYFAARRDTEAVRTLLDYAIERHYPDVAGDTGERALGFLDRVIAAQVRTVVDWMRIGFIHGVMNTDNTTISGETIDFGPCAMMSAYEPGTVFSSIDQYGRYAFGNQPNIIGWNMARLAECLLPLVHDDEHAAIELVQTRIERISPQLESAWTAMMADKLGLGEVREGDPELIAQMLDRMRARSLDYTTTFIRLAAAAEDTSAADAMRDDLGPWLDRWLARLDEGGPRSAAAARMHRVNPVVIPRNHHVEAALAACVEGGDSAKAEALLAVLRTPYTRTTATPEYEDPPADGDRGYRTFCGT